MKKVVYSLLVYFSMTPLYGQGILDGYMKGKGNLDIALSYSFEESNRYYRGAELVPVVTRINSGGLFAVYGILNNLDVVTSIPYVKVNETAGLQDGGFYLRYRPIRKAMKKGGYLNWMIGGGVNLPLSNYALDNIGAVGLQVTSFDARTIVQFDFPKNGFIQLQGGYLWRYDFLDDGQSIDVPNNWQVSMKLGLTAGPAYFDLWLDVQNAIGGNDDALNAEIPLQTFAVSYVKVGGTIYVSLTNHFGIFANFATILNGRNTIQSNRGGLGIVIKI